MSATPRQIFQKMVEVITTDKFMDTFRRCYVVKTVRPGTLMGTDQFGNKYYQAPPGNMELRERWVELGGKKSLINGCRIPPEWHMWLTRISHDPPTKIKLEQPQYALKWNPPELSRMAQEANYVPSHYFVKPKDVQPVKYPRQKYTSWTPPTGVAV
eukprot:UN03079